MEATTRETVRAGGFVGRTLDKNAPCVDADGRHADAHSPFFGKFSEDERLRLQGFGDGRCLLQFQGKEATAPIKDRMDAPTIELSITVALEGR